MSKPSAQRLRGSDGQVPPDAGPERGRFTARRTQEVVLRLLRGEPLETVAREIGVTAATLSGWRDQVLLAGTGALTSRHPDQKDEDLGRVPAKIGELTMANELLQEKIDRLEGDRP
jgi:transposase